MTRLRAKHACPRLGLACLPSLHVPNVCAKLAVWGRGGHWAAPWTEKLRTASDLRSPRLELVARHSHPPPCDPVHWRGKPSARHPHHVTAIIMPILPVDHVPGPTRPFAPAQALLRGSPSLLSSSAEVPAGGMPLPSSLPLGLGGRGSDPREGGCVTPRLTLLPCSSHAPRTLYLRGPGLLSPVSCSPLWRPWVGGGRGVRSR